VSLAKYSSHKRGNVKEKKDTMEDGVDEASTMVGCMKRLLERDIMPNLSREAAMDRNAFRSPHPHHQPALPFAHMPRTGLGFRF